MNPSDVQRKVIDLLRSKLIDVNSYRRSKQKNWIYSDFPKLTATMPRISVELIDSPLTPLGVGTNARIQNLRFDVSILVDRNAKYDVNNDGEKNSPEEVASHLSHEVMATITKNQSELKETGLLYLYPTDERQLESGNSNTMLRQVELQGILIRRFSEI